MLGSYGALLAQANVDHSHHPLPPVVSSHGAPTSTLLETSKLWRHRLGFQLHRFLLLPQYCNFHYIARSVHPRSIIFNPSDTLKSLGVATFRVGATLPFI